MKNREATPSRGTGRLFRLNRTQTFIFLCLLPTLLLVFGFTYFPILKGISVAFQNYSLFNLTDVHFVGLQNFRTVLAGDQFKTILKNTALWVIISLVLQFVIGFCLALLMRKSFRGRGVYQGFVFYSWALSGFLIGIIWRWLFNGQIGVINDLLLKFGLITERIGFLSDPKWAMFSVIVANVWYGVAFFAIMLLAALQSVPSELYEAAEIDGASRFNQLFHVTIPYIMPTIISTTALRVIWIFNFPDLIYGMTNGGPAGSTHILTTYMLDKIVFSGDYGQASAIGIICIAILALFTTFYLFATRAEKAGDF
ncbi:carbohydrate ABC transporter permease [Paenibacillus elgii]|uniref:Sugar ABC transporter permease n=1 Tax=Paenibacillus elgii TaxID=189691 RepID=A0A2T6FXX1_9BACL|nr:sugar ABC transporter permease [Paenibacillus elgii]MCM3267963.1 sugar ABC transporter permease [Paenibacillus elgii]NEN86379.1 sugar ABC transporter permease [Paenibacillus elgii]PUA36730.1 sugar ABC transporter permease [Paenibacillus elgii]